MRKLHLSIFLKQELVNKIGISAVAQGKKQLDWSSSQNILSFDLYHIKCRVDMYHHGVLNLI